MAAAMVSRAQIRAIRGIAHGRLGWSNEEYHRWLADRGGPASTLQLRRAEAANLIDILKDLAGGRSPRVWRINGATLRQRAEIDRLARVAGFAGDARLGGVIRRATHRRANRVSSLSIHEARAVIEALRAIAARQPAAT